MRTVAQIESLLPELNVHTADELEEQDIDFKQWDQNSRDKAVKLVGTSKKCHERPECKADGAQKPECTHCT